MSELPKNLNREADGGSPDVACSGWAFHFKQWGGVDKKATGRVLNGRTWDELPSSGNAGAVAPPPQRPATGKDVPLGLSPAQEMKQNLQTEKCNHVWREGPSCAALKSKDALMDAITRSKSSGRWLRGEELAWGKELEAEGMVTLCCDGKAATSLPNATAQTPPDSGTQNL